VEVITVDIKSATAENRRGKKTERRKKKPQDENIMSASATHGGHKNTQKLECGAMPNVMVELPNIGGALCSTPQSLADAHYLNARQ